MSKKESRPVKCFVCKKKMYYSDDPKFETEYTICENKNVIGYAHRRCIKRELKNEN